MRDEYDFSDATQPNRQASLRGLLPPDLAAKAEFLAKKHAANDAALVDLSWDLCSLLQVAMRHAADVARAETLRQTIEQLQQQL